ncbi:hypothetical protein VNG_0697H [Halobacterium salinarum NRC-1]|uniref:Uncharacterized protein n=2 Tax=Halobacterium salinarum TaxID=2242 RepID=Q9HRH4_HALSA|nr:hypothetical protein VNG_0697H [Halobacterium salinarum NRC-1]MBB6090027.1 hypothetical protein [Halobacterium salinarum]
MNKASASGLDPEAVHQFFAVDPDGRTLEFQTFLDEPAE